MEEQAIVKISVFQSAAWNGNVTEDLCSISAHVIYLSSVFTLVQHYQPTKQDVLIQIFLSDSRYDFPTYLYFCLHSPKICTIHLCQLLCGLEATNPYRDRKQESGIFKYNPVASWRKKLWIRVTIVLCFILFTVISAMKIKQDDGCFSRLLFTDKELTVIYLVDTYIVKEKLQKNCKYCNALHPSHLLVVRMDIQT